MKVRCLDVQILLYLLWLLDHWLFGFFCFVSVFVHPHDLWLFEPVGWLSDYVDFDLLLDAVILLRAANDGVAAPLWMMLLHVVIYVMLSVLFIV